MKLFEIPVAFEQIEEELADAQGELSPELEARIAEFLSAGKDKLEHAAMVVRSLESDVEACHAEAKRLSLRAASLQANVDRLKKLMVVALDQGFAGKCKTPLFSLWNQNAQQTYEFDCTIPLDALELADPDLVKVERKLNTAALKEAVEQGAPLPEAVKVIVNERTRYLRIR